MDKCSFSALKPTLRACGQKPGIYSGLFPRIRGWAGVTRCSPGPSRQASQGVAAGRGPQLAFDAFLPTWLSGPKRATHRPISLRARHYEGSPRDPLPYMYSETGALEMVWAGGCRLVWLPRPLL